MNVHNSGIGACPDPVAIKAYQAWVTNKYIGILAEQRYKENPPGFYELLYEKISDQKDDGDGNLDYMEMDPDWKKYNARDNEVYSESPYVESNESVRIC